MVSGALAYLWDNCRRIGRKGGRLDSCRWDCYRALECRPAIRESRLLWLGECRVGVFVLPSGARGQV